jgi:hypothetical protein
MKTMKTMEQYLNAEDFQYDRPAPEREDRFHGALLPARNLGRLPDVLERVLVLGYVEREYHVAEPIPPLRTVVFARFHHSSQRLRITRINQLA